MNISNNGLDLTKSSEGFSPKPYKDIMGVNGSWIYAVGYGQDLTYDKLNIYMNREITKEEATELLLDHYNKNVIPYLNTWIKVPVTQNQFDAICDLCYNIGINAFKNSTVLKKLNKKDYDGAGEAFLMWNKVNGVENASLTNRRKRELELFRY